MYRRRGVRKASKTHDVEVWLPGQQAYKEISSCSNAEALKGSARTSSSRWAERGRPSLSIIVHQGCPLGRTLVAVLENYQQRDGSIAIPEALRSLHGWRDRYSSEIDPPKMLCDVDL